MQELSRSPSSVRPQLSWGKFLCAPTHALVTAELFKSNEFRNHTEAELTRFGLKLSSDVWFGKVLQSTVGLRVPVRHLIYMRIKIVQKRFQNSLSLFPSSKFNMHGQCTRAFESCLHISQDCCGEFARRLKIAPRGKRTIGLWISSPLLCQHYVKLVFCAYFEGRAIWRSHYFRDNLQG